MFGLGGSSSSRTLETSAGRALLSARSTSRAASAPRATCTAFALSPLACGTSHVSCATAVTSNAELSSLRGSFASLGQLCLYLAHGEGLLGSPQGYPWQRKSYGGQVLVSNVGQAVVPSYPLKNAILGARTVRFRVRDGDPNDQYARLYSPEVVDVIGGLKLPRYGLGNYAFDATGTERAGGPRNGRGRVKGPRAGTGD